jgi:multicomponent Na+:H+ antiporter subunit D
MNTLIVLPILIPLLTAAVSLLAWRRGPAQRRLGLVGMAALFTAAAALLLHVRSHGIQAIQIGSWPAPYGITLVADLFAAIMVLVAGFMGLLIAVYSCGSIDARREQFGYYPLLHILLAGVCGAFLTGDLFNLYVWFEVMLIASFVLLSLGGERAQLEGAIKYVTLNLVSSALFLTAVAVVYGTTGTLNLADLHVKLQGLPPGIATLPAMLFLVAFGIKAAIFPLFFWLPASYHTPPVAVSAIFAALLTKVGVYALVRMFTLLFAEDAWIFNLLLAISALTMVTGVLGAIAQNEVRRLLSFHIISQIGYMVMGLALFGLASDGPTAVLALAATIFYIVHNIVAKTNLFLVSGITARLRGTYELQNLGGLYSDRPGLAFLFLISALSLAGLPPLSGFFAKLSLVQAGLRLQQYEIVAVALAVSLLTLLSMTKIWTGAFWKPAPHGNGAEIPEDSPSRYGLLLAPVVVLAAAAVILGLGAGPFFDLFVQAAEQLHDPAEYLHAVLGDLK